jgi:predicted MPP superfamily phosphohydrolase
MPLSWSGCLKVGGLTLAGMFGIVGGLPILDESQDPVVETVSIPICGLHPALEGFTIVQMSDIHLRPYTRPNFVQRAIALANQLQPDLIVLTGDYVWRTREAVFEVAPLLARLNARYGVYSVMGNHDYWLDIRALQAAFYESRLPVLYNEGLVVGVGKAVLYLAGVDDGWSGHPDLKLALDHAPPDTPVILLLHEPDLADETCQDTRVSLQLSGHTHGGQVRVPGRPPIFHPYLGKKYPYGLYKVKNSWLYTNRGLGVISVPLRINCPPEITQLTLVPE